MKSLHHLIFFQKSDDAHPAVLMDYYADKSVLGGQPGRLNDIMETGIFRTIPESLAAKQFGRSLDEVKHLADFFPETVAIIRISISENLISRFDLTPVDQPILKSGTVTAHEGKQLDLLNYSLIENADIVWSK